MIMTDKINPLFTKIVYNISNSAKMKAKTHLEHNSEEKLNWEWYNPREDSLPASFCMDTSIHGLRYLGEQKRHIFERLFWLIAFIGSVVSSVLLIWGIWSEYTDMPIVTVFNPTEMKLDEIPFPGITLCNVNGLQKSTLDEQINKVTQNGTLDRANFTQGDKLNMSHSFLYDLGTVLDMDYICSSVWSFTDRFLENSSTLNWFQVFEPIKKSVAGILHQVEKYSYPIITLKQVSQPCNQMISHCVWLEKTIDCDELFQGVATDYGYCCSFNSMPASLLLEKHFNLEQDKDNINVKTWENASLSYENLMFTKETMNRSVPYRQRYPGRSAGLSILLNPDVDEYFCTSTDSEGFIMGVNVPLDFPRMEDNGIAIPTNSEVFVGLRPEITMSHESVRAFPTEKRHCYFGNEYKLPHYSTYTASNCMDECIARKTIEQCNCTLLYMPNKWGDKPCIPSMYNCTDNVRKDIVENGLSESCSECLPTCTEIKYRKEVTFLPLQEKKLQKMFSTESFYKNNRLPQNVSIVHVYFSENSVHPKLRKEVTSLIGLISNAGGLLGLCMGFSVLSLLEIVYYGSLRLFCNLYRDKVQLNQSNETNLVNVTSQLDFNSQSPIIHPKQGRFLKFMK